MPSLARLEIIGHLGGDPTLQYTPGGQAVAKLSVAVGRSYRDGEGIWHEAEPDWFRVLLWGQGAERAAERLRKGHLVYVAGRMQSRTWRDKDGAQHRSWELVAERWLALTPTAQADSDGTVSVSGSESPELDDLPFA
jgi:single-strand DNA-binding protein